jgi:hypothetical protein
LKPTDWPPYGNRAECHRRGKRLDLALADLDAAVRQAPRSAVVFKNRAGVHEQKGEAAEAIRDLHLALALDPKLQAAQDQLQRIEDGLNLNAAKAGPFQQTPRPHKDPRLARVEQNPMLFYLAKGEPNACGPGCSTWIAAEGSVDSGAAERLRAFLRRVAARKMPIYFHSPGGFMQSGMMVGRLLRENAMTAGVSRSIPDACRSVSAQACRDIMRSGRILTGRLVSHDAICHSACGYALVGAKTRLVPPAAKFGVHLHTSVSVDGMTKKLSQLTPAELQLDAAARARARSYFREMGMDAGFYEMVTTVPAERLRYLTRDEIARFGIDRRDFVESRWEMIESKPSAVLKIVFEAEREKGFRTTIVRLTCAVKSNVFVGYVRSVNSVQLEPSLMIEVAAGTTRIMLLNGRFAELAMYKVDDTMRSAPIRFFESAAFEGSVQIAGLDSAHGGLSITNLSVAGLLEGLAQMQCR